MLKSRWIVAAIACVAMVALAACSPDDRSHALSKYGIESGKRYTLNVSNSRTPLVPGTVRVASLENKAQPSTLVTVTSAKDLDNRSSRQRFTQAEAWVPREQFTIEAASTSTATFIISEKSKKHTTTFL